MRARLGPTRRNSFPTSHISSITMTTANTTIAIKYPDTVAIPFLSPLHPGATWSFAAGGGVVRRPVGRRRRLGWREVAFLRRGARGWGRGERAVSRAFL